MSTNGTNNKGKIGGFNAEKGYYYGLECDRSNCYSRATTIQDKCKYCTLTFSSCSSHFGKWCYFCDRSEAKHIELELK